MLKPFADYVLIQPSKEPDKSKGGIIIPDQSRKTPTNGKVVAVGPGKFADDGSRMPMTARVGDTVYYAMYGGTEIIIEGQKYMMIRESDLFGRE